MLIQIKVIYSVQRVLDAGFFPSFHTSKHHRTDKKFKVNLRYYRKLGFFLSKVSISIQIPSNTRIDSRPAVINNIRFHPYKRASGPLV